MQNDPLNTELTLTERMYLELRIGCFMSFNSQGWDIVDHVTNVPLLNCRRFLELLMRMSDSYRNNREWEIILVNRLCPKVANIPYAESYVNVEIYFRRVFSKMVSFMKHHLPTDAYASIRTLYRKSK